MKAKPAKIKKFETISNTPPTIGQLAGRAMLVDLTVHYWTPKATDSELSRETERKYDTEGNFQKQLINKLHMKPVHVAMKRVEAVHRLYTLPWEDGGARILNGETFFKYEKEMRDTTAEYMRLADELCAEWDTLVQERKLNDKSFKAEHYPTKGEIRSRFGADLHYRPVPQGGHLQLQLSDNALAAVRASIDSDQQNRIKTAMFDLATRVTKVIKHLMERLNEYKPATKKSKAENTFHDSLVTNVQELAEFLPAINVTGDSRIDQLAAEMTELAKVSPDVLRDDEKARAKTVAAADLILKHVGDFI